MSKSFLGCPNMNTQPSAKEATIATHPVDGQTWLYKRFCNISAYGFFAWNLVIYLACAGGGQNPSPAYSTAVGGIAVFPLLLAACGITAKVLRRFSRIEYAIVPVAICAFPSMCFCVMFVGIIPFLMVADYLGSQMVAVASVGLTVTLAIASLLMYSSVRRSKAMPSSAVA